MGTPGAIPTTSPRATRPQRGGKPGEFGQKFRRTLPPRWGLVGLRQVDGMAPRHGGIEKASNGTALADPARHSLASAFGTKRPPSPSGGQVAGMAG